MFFFVIVVVVVAHSSKINKGPWVEKTTFIEKSNLILIHFDQARENINEDYISAWSQKHESYVDTSKLMKLINLINNELTDLKMQLLLKIVFNIYITSL